MELKGKKINFLGDSITAGVHVSSKDKIYHALIAQKEDCIARNYGASGSCLAREKTEVLAEGWPKSFCDRIEEMDPDADMVVVFGGVNDYGHGTAPIGNINDRTPDTFYGACHYIIYTLLEKYPGKPIIFMTPTHYQPEALPSMSNGQPFKYYVDIIREVCQVYGIPVCDLYANSGIAPILESQRKIYIPDGVHPNDLGHEIIASRFIGFVKSL